MMETVEEIGEDQDEVRNTVKRVE